MEGLLDSILVGPDVFQLQCRRHPEVLDEISHHFGPRCDALSPRDQVFAEVLAAPVELVAHGVGAGAGSGCLGPYQQQLLLTAA